MVKVVHVPSEKNHYFVMLRIKLFHEVLMVVKKNKERHPPCKSNCTAIAIQRHIHWILLGMIHQCHFPLYFSNNLWFWNSFVVSHPTINKAQSCLASFSLDKVSQMLPPGETPKTNSQFNKKTVTKLKYYFARSTSLCSVWAQKMFFLWISNQSWTENVYCTKTEQLNCFYKADLAWNQTKE